MSAAVDLSHTVWNGLPGPITPLAGTQSNTAMPL